MEGILFGVIFAAFLIFVVWQAHLPWGWLPHGRSQSAAICISSRSRTGGVLDGEQNRNMLAMRRASRVSNACGASSALLPVVWRAT